DLHELRAAQLDLRRVAVDPDDRLDARIGLERLRDAPAPVRRQAGDQDAPAGHQPSQTESRSASMSWGSAWMRPRASSATVFTSPLSFHGSSPRASVGLGARKRILNFAGR